ncbi:MAG: FHA domain-containing serine/threonine-protein kinase [Eubacteriales bacterium]|nr:FHA domain-containing serine/threonine-protein kinase [Eubacteriales bacterium]
MGIRLDTICPDCFMVGMQDGICTRCGFGMQEQPDMQGMDTYTILHGRYLIGKILGKGGFGITYKAYDLERSEICAVKEYMPGFLGLNRVNGTELELKNPNDRNRYQHGEKRFIEEAEILYRIRSYPHIVRIRDRFWENNTYYYVMSYIDGTNLKQIVKEGYRFPLNKAIEVMIRIGETLQGIYDNEGLIHRDISPENILVDSSEDYTLIDFGSAKEVDPNGQEGLSVVLKPGFAPLEQYSERMPQGSYTDVYALAGTFYFILTGNMLPTAIDRMNGSGNYIPLSQTGAGIPEALSQAVDRALMVSYKERTQTVRQFLRELQSAFVPEQQVRGEGTEVVLRPSAEPVRQEAMIATQAPRAAAYIEVVSGRFKGRKWTLPTNGERWIVGRDPNRCHIVMTYEEVSRRHFEIGFDERRKLFVGEDYSRNGLLVDSSYCHAEGFQVGTGCLIQFPETDCVLLTGVGNE